jgi:hypothetical protein
VHACQQGDLRRAVEEKVLALDLLASAERKLVEQQADSGECVWWGGWVGWGATVWAGLGCAINLGSGRAGRAGLLVARARRCLWAPVAAAPWRPCCC